MKRLAGIALLVSLHLLAGTPAGAQSPDAAKTELDRVIDAFLTRENDLARSLDDRHPLVETYIQTMAPDDASGAGPEADAYFLGKLDRSGRSGLRSLVPEPGLSKKLRAAFELVPSVWFVPQGFAEMVLVDPGAFDRDHYDFDFVRREFLGEVRTLVFETRPKKGSGKNRFLGRIWVEDRDSNIVRFNGKFIGSRMTTYLHFDSWRVQAGPGLWLPAYVYSEESDLKRGLGRPLRYKSQTRVWGYDVGRRSGLDEFTKIQVEAREAKDESEASADLSPVGGMRAWERLAEDNALDRMTEAGLLAPPGEVDQVLKTVVTNLEATNGLDVQPEVRCRVLLTTPFESFTIGHTIVLSRGLIDVLPDEASLAAILAHELAHIVLGHGLDTRYALSDRMLFSDEETFARLGFRRSPAQEAEADRRGEELLGRSPYKDRLEGVGLFLAALESRAPSLKALIRPHLGDRLAERRNVSRMPNLAASAPALEPDRVDQIAALPLGGRLKVDPWSARLELLRNKPVALLSAREKLPFEVTPFLPYLTRADATAGASSLGR